MARHARAGPSSNYETSGVIGAMKPSVDRMTLSQAVDRLTESNKPARTDLASERNKASATWDLNTEFSAARDLAEIGWIEKADELWQHISAVAPQVELGITSRYDVSGDSVDVGRYLSNEPECMLAQSVSPQAVVSVLVNISASAGIDARHLFNRGIALAAIIHSLQSAGRGVSLTVGESVHSDGHERHETFIEIQRFGDYINPARLAFWVAHPAALRRCIFRYNEQQDGDVRTRFGFSWGNGYGMPANFVSDDLSKDTIVIPYLRREDSDDYSSPEKAMRVLVGLFKRHGFPIEVRGAGSA